jgi:hypothetical protein
MHRYMRRERARDDTPRFFTNVALDLRKQKKFESVPGNDCSTGVVEPKVPLDVVVTSL